MVVWRPRGGRHVVKVFMVKGLVLNKNISLLDKIVAITSDQLDPVHYLYCRKHKIYYERPVLWYGELVFISCPKCFEEKYGENMNFFEVGSTKKVMVSKCL
jgi:hypothetical protein